MPPLFACTSCGVQIERSARSYVQQKGRVLCSTCRDRLDNATPQPPQAIPDQPAQQQRPDA